MILMSAYYSASDNRWFLTSDSAVLTGFQLER